MTGGITGGNIGTGYTVHIADTATNQVDGVGIEHFTITTGSGNDDIRTGDGTDFLSGGSGNDFLRGGGGSDVLDGGAGLGDWADYSDKSGAVTASLNGATNAVVKVDGVVEDTIRNVEDLQGGSGHDAFYGDGLANELRGAGGSDYLRGGGGNDVLDGGAGLSDWAEYFDKSASVAVGLNGATAVAVTVNGVVEDSIRSIENVKGGSGGDFLFGDGLANKLWGEGGNDVLSGGGGNDVLAGGSGGDHFLFNAALASTNVDRVDDFDVIDDTFRLDNAIFTDLTGTGILTAAQFTANLDGTAQTAADRIVYETDTGRLFYDSNGSAAGGSIQFALISANLSLTNQDFFIS